MKDDLGPVAINSALQGAFGTPFRFQETTGSTNADALEWARRGAPHGAVVVAGQQTAGRGRWGRSWRSEPGRSLLFSVILRPPPASANVGLLMTVLGLACVDAFERLDDLAVRLKWPNDVIVSGRKVAGILVESHGTLGIDAVVAGVGVNVDWPADLLPPDIRATATSLMTELSPDELPTRADLLALILVAIETGYARWLDPSSWDGIIERANTVSAVVGRRVTIGYAGGGTTAGTAVGIRADGRLELAQEGRTVAIDAGEIVQIRPD